MRHVLAVAVLGASLALGASAALAADGFDYTDRHPAPAQPAQVQTPDQPQQMAPADPSPSRPFAGLREENIEGGPR